MRAPESCFHCGEPVPAGSHYAVTLFGATQALCCGGCQAVAETIIAAELTDYYKTRQKPAKRPDLSVNTLTHVQPSGHAEESNQLTSRHWQISGITCGACAWLIEHHLARTPGVRYAHMNAHDQLRIAWNVQNTDETKIIQAIHQMGYTIHPIADQSNVRRLERKHALARLGIAGLCTMQVMMFCYPFYSDLRTQLNPLDIKLLSYAALIASLPVVGFSAWPFIRNAWLALRHGKLPLEFPIALSIVLSFVCSIWGIVTNADLIYLDSVTMFVFLLLLARYIERNYLHETMDLTHALHDLLPATAHRIKGAEETLVELDELRPQDTVLVYPGEVIPCASQLLDEAAELDTSALTGESNVQIATQGTRLHAGTLNVGNAIKIRVNDTTKIIETAFATFLSNAPRQTTTQQYTDKLAAHFTSLILLSTLLCAMLGWYWQWPDTLTRCIAVLAATCPCALSLASPALRSLVMQQFTQWGIYLKRSETIEQMANIDRVVFDKTGTLTLGEPRVREIVPYTNTPVADLLGIAAALEAQQNHPLAKAFQGFATPWVASTVTRINGQGIEGIVNDTHYQLGNPEFTGLNITPIDETPNTDIILGLRDKTQLLAKLVLYDATRPDMAELMSALQTLSITPTLLSGDRATAVTTLAQELGVIEAFSGQSPERKMQHINQWQMQNQHIAMIGDGINDAAALASADVSFALGSGTDLAKASAHGIIRPHALIRLPHAIAMARRAHQLLRYNTFWALLYNVTAIGFAVAGMLSPWQAAIGMCASAAFVVANTYRIRARSTAPLHTGRPAKRLGQEVYP
jgi:P-type Cu2+ transporter